MMETPISDSVVWHTLFRAQHVFMQLQLGTRSKTLDGSIAYAKLVVLQRVNSLQLYLSISYAFDRMFLESFYYYLIWACTALVQSISNHYKYII